MQTRTTHNFITDLSVLENVPEAFVDGQILSESEYSAFFEKMYISCYDRIRRYFFFRLRNTYDADDLTQTVFLKAYSSLKKRIWNGAGGVCYIFIIARNTLIDHFRKKKSEPIFSDDLLESMSSDLSTADPIEECERRELIVSAMQELHLAEIDAVTLRFFFDLDYHSVAEIMHKKEDAVRQLVHRGIKSLRNLLPDLE